MSTQLRFNGLAVGRKCGGVVGDVGAGVVEVDFRRPAEATLFEMCHLKCSIFFF